MSFFKVENITKRFGGLRALTDVSFEVEKGEVIGIIGPNGAGKTTLYNVISGAFKPDSGNIFFEDKNITGLPMNIIAKKGIVRTFQSTTVWKKETVKDNLYLAHYLCRKGGPLTWFLNTPRIRNENSQTWQKVNELLKLTGLWDSRNEVAENMPHGKLRVLGVCIALAAEPKMLLLDEPVSGMNPSEKLEMVELIKKLLSQKITIVIIEHDMATLMGLAERIIVLNMGVQIAAGLPKEIRENTTVIEAYMGTDED
ncbi:MAG: ABC transporter ATP-binding protein [Pseudomonadota bacterium]